MKTVITSGTGLAGKALSSLLRAAGHSVVCAAPSTGINALSCKGLACALTDAEVVVDVSLSPSFADDEVVSFFEQSTRNLLRYATAAGVSHYVALSVVGAERALDSSYMRAKRRQEILVSEGGLPWSILRATQFFENLGAIADASLSGADIHLSPVEFQPVAVRDVAAALAELVMAQPLRGMREIAGPKRYSMAKLVQHYLKCINDPRVVIPDYGAQFLGAVLAKTSLVPQQQAYLGSTDFETWLADMVEES